MRHQLAAFIDSAITGFILLVVGVVPLLFLHQTTEFFEIPKLIFLVAVTVVLCVLWALSWVINGRITFTRTPLDIPMLLLLAVVVLSTIFSASHFSALFGNFPKVHGSLISWVTYILLYFVTVSHIRTIARLRVVMYVILLSAILVSIVTVLSFFNILLPFEAVTGVNFTPTGSGFSTVALLLMLLPIPVYSIINPNKYIPLPVALALSVLFCFTITLIGTPLALAVLAVIFILSYVMTKPRRPAKTLIWFAVPIAVIAVPLLFIYAPPPGNFTLLQQYHDRYPKEVQLPFEISWSIAVSAFRDHPIVGSGPSTYLFNLTQYKPIFYNQYPFWNLTFDSAFNELLHIFGTLGIGGVVAIALLFNGLVRTGIRSFRLNTPALHGGFSTIVSCALAISAVVSILLLAIHASTLVAMFTMVMIWAMLMASQKAIRENFVSYSIGLKASSDGNRQLDILPVIAFLLIVAGAVFVAIQMPAIVMADYYHRLALNQANTNATRTYEYLQQAERLNPYLDTYRVDMAQTNFALANAIATRNGQSSGASASASLSEKDKEAIQTLISQAINEGKASVTLSPRSARNWEVLGAIYRNITGVAENSLTYALDAYGRAIQLDPMNPALRLHVGGIYYSMKDYESAIRYYSDAVNLKPDYASAYYQLSVTLRDRGDIQNATRLAERAVQLLSKTSVDYPIAVRHLEALQSQSASGSAAQPPSTTPVVPSITPAPTVISPTTAPSVTPTGIQQVSSSPTDIPVQTQESVPSIPPTVSPDSTTQE